ncbi:hypothetical protein P153DRAFT_355973 [Dothidotthia symphoricarpi CBS 119687]|uniref:Uncharacterized protein n=1 Tax=Dothidotthia symphoricarpi CBS 119687 TaxID=1392245 RepID=A0A6A6AL93_9PLEO|nr:uncharacterized protein P153DRAFT_355973 [Dothidotthia symphoricarpi CBS 119687]KAF2131221.1 hypothetical protein P153DRAFT_355973 [Dothidotthia symphoricarpi CBS 119687]
MLLFPTPRYDHLLGATKGGQTPFTKRRLSLPIWPVLSAFTSTATSRRSSAPEILPRSTTVNPTSRPTQPKPRPQTTTAKKMPSDHYPSSPRFSPTLGSIPEVFEFDVESPARRGSHATVETPSSTPEAFIPEITLNPPKISMKNAKGAIVQVTKKVIKAYDVTGVLRKVLEADQVRRRRILKIYLKALVFLKYLWHSSDRYGSIMAQSGFQLQR